MMSVSFVLLEKVGRSSKLSVKSPCSPHAVGVGDAETELVTLEVMVEEDVLAREVLVDSLLERELLVESLILEVNEFNEDTVVEDGEPDEESEIGVEADVKVPVGSRLIDELSGPVEDIEVPFDAVVMDAAEIEVLPGGAPVDGETDVAV